MNRSARRPRTDWLTTLWMLAALTAGMWVLVGAQNLPHAWWTAIHVVTLGVLTNGILQWSWYFARGLLRLAPYDRRAGRDATVRSLALNAILVALIAAVWANSAPAVVFLSAALGAVIAWHGFALAQASRRALGSNHAIVLRFYVAAASMFVLGCAIAGAVAVVLVDPTPPSWLASSRDELTLAHAVVMGAGWIGLSISGTLVTLGPTMLRARMDDSAVPRAVRALPWLVALVITAGIAAAVGAVQLAGVALGAYGAALVWAVALPLARAAAAKGPREHASWSMLGGLAWTTVSIGAIAITLVRATDAGEARSQIAAWIPLLAAGGIAQVFVGALAYLMPVVIGGGPQSVRTGIGTIETLSPLRLVARNVSLLALAVSMNTAVPARGAWWAVVIVTFAVDIAALGAAGVRQARAKREAIAADVAA